MFQIFPAAMIRFVIICALFAASISASTSASMAASAVDKMFAPLYGKWRGKGVIALVAGKPAENISCRVTYKKASAKVVNTNIRCAAVDFKINASGHISYSGTSKMFRGNLSDGETGWTLVLTGGQPKKRRIRFGLKIAKAQVNGWLDLSIKSKKSHSWLARRTTSSGLKQLLRINFRR